MTVIKIVPMPGPQGSSGNVADFVFNYDADNSDSVMSIANHDMVIRTTRTGSQDADIDIESADDVWITANDQVEISSTTDNVTIFTDDYLHEWSFQDDGGLRFPNGTVQTTAYTGASLDNIKTRIWEYPSANAVAIMPETDNESIALKSSDAAAIRWHVRNNGVSGESISPTSATVTAGDGNYNVVFTIPEQNSVPVTGEYYYQISCPDNSAYDGAYFATAATTTTITFSYETDPGAFVASGSSISQPSVYSQFEVDSNGAHIKIADWSSGPGSYSHNWDFTKEGAIHFPYGPSNNRTGYGDVLRFASSVDQAIITGPAATEGSPTANRLVVAGQDGYTGTSGEGGDVYLWAGQGGSSNGNGGDIKVDGGNANGSGQAGYVKIRGGYSPNGEGGFVNIEAGNSSTSNGGNVSIYAGNSFNGENTYGGAVQIYSGQSNTNGYGGNIYLTTQSGGKVFLQPAADHAYVGTESPENRIAQVGDLAYIRVAVPTSSIGAEGDHLNMVADDGTHHYYCTGTYDGTTNIWKRIAWSNDTWPGV